MSVSKVFGAQHGNESIMGESRRRPFGFRCLLGAKAQETEARQKRILSVHSERILEKSRTV